MSFRKIIIFVLVAIIGLFVISNVGKNLAQRNNGGEQNPPVGSGDTETPNEETPTPTGKGALIGFIPSSPDINVLLEILGKNDPFKRARSLDAQVQYWYFGWKDIETGGWSGPDRIMRGISDGTKSAAVISVINTATLSQYPKGYKSFIETGFTDDYAAFAASFAKKYKPDYLFIGNEANTYLSKHSQEVGAFEEVLKKGAVAIKAASPNTKVGVSVAYRDGLHDNFSLIKKLSASVDIIGYTVYAFTDPNFEFGNPQEGIDMLKQVRNAVPGKPYAVIETGWNSSEVLGSSEKEQAQFATLLRNYIKTSDAEFITWFILQDGRDCSMAARGFLSPGQNPTGPQFDRFKEFLCKFGIYNADGTPKEAVGAWNEAR